MKKIGFDIGSWNGDTLFKFPEFDEIYAFEPHPVGFNELKEKKIPNVYAYNLGISSIPGVKKFYGETRPVYGGCSSFLELDNTGEFTEILKKRWNMDFKMIEFDIDCIRLDSFLLNNNIDHIDFLKIDTQGSDYDVILSLGDKIKHVKKIELEVILKPFYKNQPTRDDIINYLQDKNFILIEETPNHDENLGYENNLIFINKNYE